MLGVTAEHNQAEKALREARVRAVAVIERQVDPLTRLVDPDRVGDAASIVNADAPGCDAF